MGGKRSGFGLGAPFGRIGAALGFRWIMPMGTIPLPFHPWLAWLLPWGIVALIGWRVVSVSAGQDGSLGWGSLLFAAGLIAIPLAIPIIQWLAMAFRVPLLQGLLIGGAMALLAVDAGTGALPLWTAAIPLAWLGLYVVQRVAGPAYLRGLQAANDAFGRIDAGNRLVIVERDRVGTSYASHLSAQFALARVAIDPDRSTRFARLKPQTQYRLAPADLAALEVRIKRLQPKDWSVWDGRVTVPGIADPGTEPPLRLRMARHRAPFWLIGGRRAMLEIRDGRTVHRLVGGEAALTGRWPLFVCFCYVNIFNGAGRLDANWIVGFVRGKAVELGPARFWDMVPRAFAPLAEAAAPPYADPAPLHAALDKLEAEVRTEAADLLARLLRLDPDLPFGWTFRADERASATGHGPALCDCLAAAQQAGYKQAVRLAAGLLAALPADEYRTIGPRLIALLNSKELAFRLLDENARLDMSEREKMKHVRGGYELLKYAPDLYARLGELGEPARRLVMGMGQLGNWPPALVRAREMLDAPRGDS